jgi:hypothetical protein
MPGSPELASQGLDFRLVQAAANRVKEDFHGSIVVEIQSAKWGILEEDDLPILFLHVWNTRFFIADYSVWVTVYIPQNYQN